VAHEVNVSHPEPTQLGRAQPREHEQPDRRLVGISDVGDELVHLFYGEDPVAFSHLAPAHPHLVPGGGVLGESFTDV
jgi:hypothetical protein